MKSQRSSILRHFRGRRVFIPLVAGAVIVFLGLGGYRVIVRFAMDEMMGFLVGTDVRGDQPVLAKAGEPKAAEPAAKATAEPQGQTNAAAKIESKPEMSPESQPAAVAVALGPVSAGAPEPGETQPVGAQAKSALGPGGQAELLAAAEPSAEDSTAVRRQVKAYTGSYLRDPFYSLVQVGKDRPSKLLDVGQAKMVGSVWGESGIIALLEDSAGRSYALKVGDRVLNGKVISVTPASTTFSITAFDLTKDVTLELAGEGE